ncbi:hypothetical protein M1N45_01445, partial [Dehalococcoidia bacterium]|nr:hypothetical protein [Dehalococcoidia bacterium]
MMIYIDRLSTTSIFQMLPAALANLIRRRRRLSLVYFSASAKGESFLGVFRRLGLMLGEEAEYSYVDVRDASGASAIPWAEEMGSLPVCHLVSADLFQASSAVSKMARRFDRERLLLYLEKSLSEDVTPHIIRIGVVSWFRRTRESGDGAKAIYLAARNPWLSYLREIALENGVTLRGYRVFPRPGELPMKRIKNLVLPMAFRFLTAPLQKRKRVPPPGKLSKADAGQGEAPPFSVAMPYSGNGLTLDASKNSDLFWIPSAGLLPGQVLVYATRGDDPIDETKNQALRNSSIRAIATNKAARTDPSVPTWPQRSDLSALVCQMRREWRFLTTAFLSTLLKRGTEGWISSQLFRFTVSYNYWRWFFASHKVKLYVDYWDWNKNRLASDQAVGDLGGLSVSYQRSYQPFPSVFNGSAVDVHFAFSTSWVETERDSRSSIRQFVSNGYVHDHALRLVRERAAEIRNDLVDRGARFIVCFLDENSTDDQRVGPSHPSRAENYRYLLEKLLADPSLGLIFKPKKPNTLRRRLGSVSELLDAALATGRCYLYEEGIVSTENLPCEASSAADVTVA